MGPRRWGPGVWEGYRKREAVKVCPCGTGPGSKRLGIDGDREAVPLTLQIMYSKVRPLLGPVSLWGLLLTRPHPESPPVFPGPRLSAGRLQQAPLDRRGGSGHPSPLPPPKPPPPPAPSVLSPDLDVLSSSCEVLGPGCRAEGEGARVRCPEAQRGRAQVPRSWRAWLGAREVGPCQKGFMGRGWEGAPMNPPEGVGAPSSRAL